MSINCGSPAFAAVVARCGAAACRLAIVPMSQEARGLDAGRRLVERLKGAGDPRTASIVAAIAEEERAHVAVGVVWFGRLCSAQGVAPPEAFRAWLAALAPELLKGPFNHEERQQVGLQREWYDVSAWPQQLQQQLVKPAVAAAARGKGLALTQQQQQQQQQQHGNVPDAGSSSSSVQGQGLPAPVPVPAEGGLLELLRQRLWSMVELEAEMCGSGSSSSSDNGGRGKGVAADCAAR
uniref:Uncharacterized protein n=1 Tax=Tetradesmus obliquus TaxID=3088 RepID=A0A383W2U5_TETOB|eukprot:jgi/Sobl393_1/6006/SZX70986.1